GLHDHRDAADLVDVVHDVVAEGLQVPQVRDLVADAVEVLELEVDLRLAGVHVAAAVGRGRGGRAGQGHAQGLANAGHRVGGVHATAGAFTRADGPLDGVEVLLAHLAGGARAHGLEGVDEGDFLLRAVLELSHTGHDRAGVDEDAGQVQARGGHQHARQRLVAAGQQDGAVDALGHHDGLDRVGDDLAGDQGEVHALMAHGDAVRDGDRAELHGEPAAGVHALLGGLRQAVQGKVAGGDFVPRAGHADLRLGEVLVPHADRAEHAAGRGSVDAVGDGSAAWLDVNGAVLAHRPESRTTCRTQRTRDLHVKHLSRTIGALPVDWGPWGKQIAAAARPAGKIPSSRHTYTARSMSRSPISAATTSCTPPAGPAREASTSWATAARPWSSSSPRCTPAHSPHWSRRPPSTSPTSGTSPRTAAVATRSEPPWGGSSGSRSLPRPPSTLPRRPRATPRNAS